jgi:DNA/RNA-binding domain of Phe-tRNA-synthetase-like protein/molybdopterin converting factor small subunit
MDVTVVCFGAMREHLPEGSRDNRASVEVRDGATVGDVVDALGAPRALAFAVLLDGTQATLDAHVSEGSEVTLMPPFAGGASDLRVGSPIWDAFDGMSIVVARVRDLDPGAVDAAGIAELLDGAWEQAREMAPAIPNAQSHPHVAPWRQRMSALGVSGGKFPSSIEALLRRALKGGPPPRIHPLVDLYNALSLRHITPLGAFDVARLDELRLDLTEGMERFVALGDDEHDAEVVAQGEVAYLSGHDVLTRHFVWRQANLGAIGHETSEAVVLSEVLGELPSSVSDAVAGDLEEALRKYMGGTPDTRVLKAGGG